MIYKVTVKDSLLFFIQLGLKNTKNPPLKGGFLNTASILLLENLGFRPVRSGHTV